MRHPRGFSLIEVLVATSIVAVGVTALAQLFVVAISANYRAKAATFAAVLAQQKMEQLRSVPWGLDGFGLTPSPPDVLDRNTPGYCDFVDGNGNPLGSGFAPPNGTVYVRRWSVDPLPDDPLNALILQVLATPARRGGAAEFNSAVRRPDEARLVSVRTRKAS